MIDREAAGGPGPATRLVRYQGPDHAGSSRLETDENARVIGYEEFHPFGTTAYQAVDKDVAAAARRYRYVEMERDEESGLAHHGARYYIPWLGRWSTPDKLAGQPSGNRYAYAMNNPIVHTDTNGMFEEPLHGATSFRLLVAAGFAVDDAARIALANAAMDHDPADQADVGQTINTPERVRHGHFDPEHAVSRIEADIAGFRGRTTTSPSDPAALETFGRNLHNLEDVGFPDEPGPHMRGTKFLSSDLIAAGVIVGAIGGGLLGAGLQPKTSTGARTALVDVAFVLFFVSLVLVSIGISVLGLGHGEYTSEVGEKSAWYPQGKYVNDEAYQDPVANTRLLRREYEYMVRAAEAYYGGPRSTVDRAAAERAIYEVTHADTSARISAVLNADAGGRTYLSILPGRETRTRPGEPAWFKAGSETRGVDVGPFSEQTQARVKARGETPDAAFRYVPRATWTWGYR
jgi:RHS repeat-associated protein